MQQQTNARNLTRKYSSVLIISGLVLILLLLSTCGNITDTTNTNTALTTPPIDMTLESQGDIQLQTFQQWITLMKQYNGDTSPYQKQYSRDQQALQSAITPKLYKKALTTLKAHVIAIQMPAMKIEGQQLQQQLKQKVNAWGQQHQFHNSFDNKDYPLGYEYGDNGIGSWVQDDLTTGNTLASIQQTIEDLHMYLYNFQAMTEDATESAPYNAVHQTDLKIMQHNGKTNGKVIIVSLHEQAMRVYEDSKLVNAFLITTGRPDRPTPPGDWWIEGKESPTIFKSGVPEGSPNWYPDTPINYAMQYHSNGYFIHDSWWRNDYGPGTNFPHNDSSSDTFSAQGSHGCVNLSKDNAGWLYGFVDLYTSIIIY
jgi:lipoprotein-anchoring transpeptidase ErfK/SrfK